MATEPQRKEAGKPQIQRGQIWQLAHGIESMGLIAGALALVVQNDPYNLNAAYPWCLVAAVGSTQPGAPTHVAFSAADASDLAPEIGTMGIRAERLGCIPKVWLTAPVGRISAATMRRVEQALGKVLALP